MNESFDDYLKIIYEKEKFEKKEFVKNQDIIKILEFTPQTVNEAIRKLNSKGYIEFTPYKGSKLTKKGEKQAYKLVRSHQLIETFLVNKLNLNWSEVHREAEKLEHATSENVVLALEKYLMYPKYCPHGNPIPDLNGHFELEEFVYLMNAKENKEYIFRSLKEEYFSIIEYLNDINLEIGDTLKVTKIDKTNNVYFIKNISKRNDAFVGEKIAKILKVEEAI